MPKLTARERQRRERIKKARLKINALRRERSALLRQIAKLTKRIDLAESKLMPANTPHSDVITAIRTLANASGLAFIPKLSRKLGKRAHAKLLLAEADGAIELRPEGGINRLTATEKQLCIPGPHQTLLSWAREVTT